MCSSYARCHFPSPLNAVGAIGITTSSGTFSGLGVCSAVFAELPSGVLDASLRLKERGCAGTPVCVQVPVISDPVSFIFPHTSRRLDSLQTALHPQTAWLSRSATL